MNLGNQNTPAQDPGSFAMSVVSERLACASKKCLLCNYQMVAASSVRSTVKLCSAAGRLAVRVLMCSGRSR